MGRRRFRSRIKPNPQPLDTMRPTTVNGMATHMAEQDVDQQRNPALRAEWDEVRGPSQIGSGGASDAEGSRIRIEWNRDRAADPVGAGRQSADPGE